VIERFPEPDAAARATSEALLERIRDAIDAAGGWIGFDRFMQMALYEPGLGYYSAGSVKLGAGGDFTTAPETGDWLGKALAQYFERAFGAGRPFELLELGAGSGKLAEALLAALAVRGRPDVDYLILEPSAELRERQRQRLDAFGARVRWLDGLPETPIRGVVLANEVADALPVQRFLKRGSRVLPLGVALEAGRLALRPGPEDPALAEAVAVLETALGRPFADGYRSEICPALNAWIGALCKTIAAGGLMLIDYGLPCRDYYRAERADGTLICHYRHRAHDDPLFWPGLQDISAWVDFSAVVSAGRAAGFELAGFTTQAQFLLESIALDPGFSGAPAPAAAAALKTLVLPGEMGERFKLIWLTRGIDRPALPGRDFRSWL
jgi:SAM-dependent MidA family methyltransferase